jgi:pimeloyl-ACP methyl ester carboxylesterase
MKRKEVLFGESTISFLEGGSGTNILLCLHGFGETAASFAFLEPHIGERFTMYAIDFPWHGQTNWKGPLAFTSEDLLQVFSAMIPDFSNRMIYLLAYSMGGRVALSLIEAIPLQIHTAVLLAPDGLRMNPWYWLATQTALGNQLFRYTMKHPAWFQFSITVLRRLKLANESIARFVEASIDDVNVRQDLFLIWTTMRKFRPRLGSVQEQINQHQLSLALVFGKFDRIILAKNGYRFQSNCKSNCNVLEVDGGHRLLKEQYVPTIISLLHSD